MIFVYCPWLVYLEIHLSTCIKAITMKIFKMLMDSFNLMTIHNSMTSESKSKHTNPYNQRCRHTILIQGFQTNRSGQTDTDQEQSDQVLHCLPFRLHLLNEPPHDKTNKMICAPSEDSDQPSLIRVFVVRMKKAWVLSYILSRQRRLWSDWVAAQADLSLHWMHSHFVGFVVRQLKSISLKVKPLCSNFRIFTSIFQVSD